MLKSFFYFKTNLAGEFLAIDLNGVELNRWKRLKRKASKTFMEKTANANLILQAISNVAAIGMKILL